MMITNSAEIVIDRQDASARIVGPRWRSRALHFD